MRAAVGIAVTIGAALVVYGTLTAAAHVPVIEEVIPDLPTPVLPTPVRTLPRQGIRIEPDETLVCPVSGCSVTIHSTGTAPLWVDTITFDGPNAKDFRYRGQCERQHLAPGGKCTLRVTFTPTGSGGTRTARLVVNQNSTLALEGRVPAKPDFTPSKLGAFCQYVRTGDRDFLQVRFQLLHSGLPTDKSDVGVSARSATGGSVNYRSALERSTFLIPVKLGQPNLIDVTVDPANEVAERDETNNRMRVTVTPPPKLASPSPLICRFG